MTNFHFINDTTTFMRRVRQFIIISATLMLTGFYLQSCGSVRTYGGIEHEYTYDFDGHHHHKPPKKHKKNKKHHKKHHRHHDDRLHDDVL